MKNPFSKYPRLSTISFMVIGIPVILIVVAAGFHFYSDSIRHDGHMHFPSESHGPFVRQPHLVFQGDRQSVHWTLPEACSINSYEAVTTDYVMDEQPRQWDGSGDVRCVTNGDLSRTCYAFLTPELETAVGDGHDLWFVAKASECGESGGYYVSDRLTITDLIDLSDFEALLEDYRQPYEEFSLLTEDDGTVWVRGNLGRHIISLSSIDRESSEVTEHYDLADLNIVLPEFSLNPSTRRILYSTHHVSDEFEPGKEIPLQYSTLYVRDLDTGRYIILTEMSRMIPYAPSWIGSNVIEYTSARTGERVNMPLSQRDERFLER